jgi:hypothetical protein
MLGNCLGSFGTHKSLSARFNFAFFNTVITKSIIMASNEEQPTTEVKMFGDGDHPLSKVSTHYDVGDKGFLTDTEKQMRGMDSDNLGHLTNAQVSSVVTETLALRETTGRMKTWLGILGVFVVILALSNLGTAFAAAWLAKDTTVNESSGKLLVKDSDTPVMAQSYGQTSTLVLEEESNSYGCMDREDAAKLWAGVLDGTPSALTIQDSSEMDAEADPSVQAFFALVLTTNGATWNDTIACMPVSNDSGDQVCIDFTDHRCDAAHTDRALEVVDHHTRRQLFHAAAQGHRGLATKGGSFALSGNVPVSYYSDGFSDTGTIELGTASEFAILAKSGISTVPTSDIRGDIGVSPISAAAITGFDLTLDSSTDFSTADQVTGSVYAANYGGSTPPKMTTAVSNMETAYTNAAGRTNSNAARKNINGGELGGLTLTPGITTFSTSVTITGNVDLTFATQYDSAGPATPTLAFDTSTDNEDAIFIIQISGDLTVAAGINLVLSEGAQAKNIYWQVSGAIEIGANSHIEGILLAATSVTFLTGSTLNGRILSQTACVLQSATITPP